MMLWRRMNSYYFIIMITITIFRACESFRGVNLRLSPIKYHLLSMSHQTDSLPCSLLNSVNRASISNSVKAVATVAFILSPKSGARAASSQWLTEPTSEFVDEEKRSSARNMEEKKTRKEWDALISKLEATETAPATESVIKELTALLRKVEDIPVGVKKRDLVKLCRSKKFEDPKSKKKALKVTWGKSVEIAYEELIFEFNKQFGPKNMKQTDII